MHSETASGRAASRVACPSSPMADTTAAEISPGEALASSPERRAAHDANLLVAALERLEAQRRALEWLLDAELLSLLVV